MEVLQGSLFGIKVAIVAAPLAVSVLTCAKTKKDGNQKKASLNSGQKSISNGVSKDHSSEANPPSKKDNLSEKKQSDSAKNSIKSQKAISLKQDSIKVVDKEEKQANEELANKSIKPTSLKTARLSINDDSSKKVEESRKEESQKEITKSVSIKAENKNPSNDESAKKVGGAQLKEAIAVEPQELRVAAAQDVTTKLNLENKTDTRKAIKIKCSDNGIFRINPVYALVEPNSKAVVEVSRCKATAKPDKLDVVVAEADAEAKDGQEVFKASAIDKLVTVNVPVFAA